MTILLIVFITISTIYIINELIKTYKGEIEFVALSKENYLSAPPTLYFLINLLL